MTITARPFSKWDVKRLIQSDPLLSVADRAVALEFLNSFDNRLEPVERKLQSETIIGGRVGAWRETVCRSLRRLRVLGYFRSRWVTVQRATLQGIKGVTRVRLELGPVLVSLRAEHDLSPGHAHGVISHHTPRPPQAEGVAVSGAAVTKSTDRMGSSASDRLEDRRQSLARWPRLAGSRPLEAGHLPSSRPASEVLDFHARAAEADAALEAKRARIQPRRRPPRAKR